MCIFQRCTVKFAQWVTPSLDFKVTIFFNVKYFENGRPYNAAVLAWQTNLWFWMTPLTQLGFQQHAIIRRRISQKLCMIDILLLYRLLIESDMWPIELCHRRDLASPIYDLDRPWRSFKLFSLKISVAALPVSDRKSGWSNLRMTLAMTLSDFWRHFR